MKQVCTFQVCVCAPLSLSSLKVASCSGNRGCVARESCLRHLHKTILIVFEGRFVCMTSRYDFFCCRTAW